MRSPKNTLVISDNIHLIEELKRLLAQLDIPDIAVANSDKEAVNKFLTAMPAFTFLDLDSETIKTEPLVKVIQNSNATTLSLIYKKDHKFEWLDEIPEKIYFINKPVTLTKLNDIVNPHLSFANLLEEAKALLRQETGKEEW